MQESRLFKIIYYLLDKGQATAPELAEKFEVSVRTIYRDIDALSGAGIPVYVTTGRKGGIRLLDNYVLDKSLFSESERTEILSTLQSLLTVQYPNAELILNKLGAIFQIHLTDWIEVEFSRWGSNAQKERKLFCDVKQSIFQKRQIVFDYYSAEAKETREVQPLKLIFKDIRQQGSGYKVNITLPENEWLYDFLMSFGDKVTIIRPRSLRRKIINRCETALTHHRKKII